MNKTLKWILIILAAIVYVAGVFLLTVNLPMLMSGGDPAVETVLTTGKTAIIEEREVDISTSQFRIKEDDTIYIKVGVNNRLIFSKHKSENSTKAIVIDVDESRLIAKVKTISVGEDDRFSFGIKFFQIIICAALILIPIFVLVKTRGGNLFSGGGGRKSVKTTTKYGNQGTAKEGSIADLREFLGNDGFSISKRIRLSAKSSYEHALVLGPTGSGKSSSFFIPNLLDLDGVHSAVVTDPKGEMCEKTRRCLEHKGYNIVKICPLDPASNEYKYNPLALTEDDQKIREIAQIILVNGGKSVEISTGSGMSSSEWINMSIPLFSAALAYAKYFGITKSIPEAIDIILRDSLEEMEKKFIKNKFAYRQFLIFKSSAESEKTLASIKSVLTTNVQIFLEDKVENFVTPRIEFDEYGEKKIDEKSLLDPAILRERPTVLFLCIPENQSTYMMPLTSVLYYQILNINISKAEGHPILCFFDEFPNSGSVLGIDTIISTCRSRRIGVSICTQGIEQLQQVYGDKITSTLLNNLKTKLIFAGLTGDSAKYVSELSGYTTVEAKNYSSGGGGKTMADSLFSGRQVSKSGVRRELLTTDEIRTMPKDKVLVIAQNANPVFDSINSYYNQKKYIKKLSE